MKSWTQSDISDERISESPTGNQEVTELMTELLKQDILDFLPFIGLSIVLTYSNNFIICFHLYNMIAMAVCYGMFVSCYR